MSFLCDFCSRSVGSRCNHNLEGVRVGGSCDRFAPTLQSVFGLRWLHDELAKGRDHIRKEVEEAARFNGFPEEERRKMLALADEVPPLDLGIPKLLKGDPVLAFESAADRDRAVRRLEADGMSGLRCQRGLVLAFSDVPTLAAATMTLLDAGIGEFRVAAPAGEDD